MKANRKIKYAAYSVIMMVGIIAVVLLVNYFITTLDTKVNLSLDMTSYRLYSLTSTTKDVLDRLDNDVFIYTTETAGIEDANIKEILKKYSSASDRLHVVNIDIVKNPAAVEYYNDFSGTEVLAGSIIISNSYDTNDSKQRYRVLDYTQLYIYDSESQTYDRFNAEDAITGAIKYIVNPNNQKIWLLDNHIKDNDEVISIKNILEDENYQVKMLDILNGQSAIEPHDIVIIISPESDLTPIETDILNEFLDSDGRMLIGIDPSTRATTDLDNALSLIERYNIKLGDGLVKESDLGNVAVTGDSNYAYSFVIPEMAEHQITNDFIIGNYKLLLGMSIGKLVLPEKINDSNITIDKLLLTSKTSYIEQWSSEMDSTPDPFAEYGEFTVMAAVTDEGNDTKLIALSAPELFTYAEAFSQNVYRNKDFLIKSISWLADDNEDFYISSKPLADAPLMLSNMNQAYFIIAIVCVAIPLLIFGAGIFIFIKRKNM